MFASGIVAVLLRRSSARISEIKPLLKSKMDLSTCEMHIYLDLVDQIKLSVREYVAIAGKHESILSLPACMEKDLVELNRIFDIRSIYSSSLRKDKF